MYTFPPHSKESVVPFLAIRLRRGDHTFVGFVLTMMFLFFFPFSFFFPFQNLKADADRHALHYTSASTDWQYWPTSPTPRAMLATRQQQRHAARITLESTCRQVTTPKPLPRQRFGSLEVPLTERHSSPETASAVPPGRTPRARVRSLRVSSEISLPFMLTCARLQFDINMTSRSRIALSFHILSSSGQRSTSAPPYSSARHQHQRHRDPLPSPPGISKSPARRSSSSGGPNATTAAAASTVPAGLMLRPVFRRPMYVT